MICSFKFKDLDNLVEWADKWQLKFNAEKCHTLHMGFNNPNYPYYMRKHNENEYVELSATDAEKDLGVIVDCDLKFSRHIETQVNKANRLLGLIRRSFTFMDAECMRLLFTSIVRPHLEFANVIWSPSTKRDCELIERVQHRATKMVPNLKKLSYQDRLIKMNLPSLRYRRLRGDMIEAYKITHGLYSVNKNLLQLDQGNRTRGHAFKLIKNNSRLKIRQHFFVNRIVNDWNALPASVAEAPSINAFKARLDKHYEHLKFCE